MTPEDRARRARMGAYAQHARHDARETTKAGREAFIARFERMVDPAGVLPVEERQRRAQHALKFHMAQLALKSAKSRRKTTGADKETVA